MSGNIKAAISSVAGAAAYTQQSANGHMVVSGSGDFDARSGALIWPLLPAIVGSSTLYPGPEPAGGSTTFDVRGDLSGGAVAYYQTWNGPYGQACKGEFSNTIGYGYDVENRTTAHSSGDGEPGPGGNGTFAKDGLVPAVVSPGPPANCGTGMPESSGVNESYQWGPNGHPQLVTGHYAAPGGGGSTYTESVHWDGDAVAFTSQNSSAYVNQYTVKPGIDKVFIGDLAEYFPSTFPVVTNTLGQNITSGTPQTLSVTFRDPSGGYVPITSASSNSHAIAPSLCLTPQLITPYINVVVCQPRNDGWQIGMTTFQGVRSYDASAAQWTTPDAYAGDVHDPMTQQKYMWNNNNPVAYSDPSGYSACSNLVQCAVDLGAEALKDSLKAVAAGAIEIRSKASIPAAIATTVLTPVPLADDTESGYNRGRGITERRRLTPGQRADVINDKGSDCTYCGRKTVPGAGSDNSLEIDHKIPVSRGGTNDPDNLTPSCRSCNRSKGAKTDAEFNPGSNGTEPQENGGGN